MKEQLAILISGNGTTMQAILRAWKQKKIPLDIACVLSSNPTARGIQRAKKLGIPLKDIIVIDPEKFRKRDKKINQEAFGRAILKELKKRQVTVIAQSGWMPLTPLNVIAEFPHKIFNQHPGPVPEFGGKGMFGKRVHAAVLLFNRLTKQKNAWTEAIIQHVALSFDAGLVVKSVPVRIFDDDTVETLHKRVLQKEHKLYIALLKEIAAGKTLSPVAKRLVIHPNKELLDHVKTIARALYPNG